MDQNNNTVFPKCRLEDKSVFSFGSSAVNHSATFPANNLSGFRFFGLYLQTVYKSPIALHSVLLVEEPAGPSLLTAPKAAGKLADLLSACLENCR